MNKRKLSIILVFMLSGSILFSSCIGSFGLFNRMKNWNHTIGNKFVNELVFVALHIVPVYEVVYLADLLVINSIEFWSGKNPAMKEGEVKEIKGENGNYTLETIENGYSITKEGEATVELIYHKENSTWNIVTVDTSTELIRMNDDGTADLFLPGGDTMNITLDAQGIVAARQVAMCGRYFAAR